MEKAVQMSDFISYCGVITEVKIMLRHFTKKSVEGRAPKLFMKRFIRPNLKAKVSQYFLVECLCYELYKVLYSSRIRMVSTWPHDKTQLTREQTYKFPFVLTLVCFSARIFCHKLARST